MAAPEFAEIKELFTQLEGDDGELIARDTEMNGLRHQTYDVRSPHPTIENWTPKIIRSGWAPHAIMTHVAMFAERPAFHHDPGIGGASHTVSEKIEGFLNTFPWAAEATFGTFWPETVEDVFKLGRGFVEVLPRRTRWTKTEGYPEQGLDEYGEKADEDDEGYNKRIENWKKNQLAPISLRHLPADSVRALITERYRVLNAVRKAEITLAEAARRWPKLFKDFLGDDRKKATEKVTCYEYADETWCCYIAEYKSVKDLVSQPYKHGMKMHPWVLLEGFTTASSNPVDRWQPLLQTVKDVGLALDSQLTRKAMITEIWPLPLPIYYRGDNDPEKADEPITISPPEVLEVPFGSNFEIKNWQGSEPEAENLWDKLDRARDRLIPDVGHDIAQGSSETAAWTWRLRGQIVERDLKPVADNLSLGAKRIAQAIARAIMSPWIDETVYVRRAGEKGLEAIGIGPAELKGQINNIHANVKSSNVMDRNQDLGAFKIALEVGLPWRDGVETILRRENPQELWDEALLEEVEKSEPYRTRLINDILQRADMLEAEQAEMPPEEAMARMGELPPGGQAAVRGLLGMGASGIPQGAAPQTITRTGVGTLTQPGPNPAAPGPGEAMPV